MGCEVWTNEATYICSIALRSKAELQEKIQECQDTINNCKERLKSLVYMTEPKKFYPEDDVQFYINKDLEEIFEEYDEARIKLTRLWVFEEAWDKTHDKETGKAFLPINPLDLKALDNKVYMTGDYCEYILEDGSEMPEDWWDVYHGCVKLEDCTFREKFGYPPYVPEPELEQDELHAKMIEALRTNGVEVDLDKL